MSHAIATTAEDGNFGHAPMGAPPAWSFSNLIFSFSGRINRGKWWAAGGIMLVAWLAFYALLGASVLVAGNAPAGPLFIAFSLLAFALYVATIWGSLATGMKRLHDLGRTGHWLWIFLVLPTILMGLVSVRAIGQKLPLIDSKAFWIVLAFNIGLGLWSFLWLGCLRGTRGANAYGADPIPHVA